MRNQRGITLIALVITIIVLLILAGVSIAMLTGDNGILNNADRAAKETAIANAREKVSTAVNEAMTDYYANIYADDGNATMLNAVNEAVKACVGTEDGASVAYTEASASSAGKVTITYDGTTVATGSVSTTGTFSWDATPQV